MNLPLILLGSVEHCKIGEPKVSADKEQNPKNSDIADNESHGRKTDRELFYVTDKDVDLIDIEDLF